MSGKIYDIIQRAKRGYPKKEDEMTPQYLKKRIYTAAQEYIDEYFHNALYNGFSVDEITEQYEWHLATIGIKHIVEKMSIRDQEWFWEIDKEEHMSDYTLNTALYYADKKILSIE